MSLWHRMMRSRHLHGDVDRLFRPHLTSGRILDLPAGGGANSRRLLEVGYCVRAADLRSEAFEIEGVPCDGVDMTRPLPYEDDSFDGVLHSEGIEHVDNQVAMLHELARVLRPGGILVVTTPNVLHLEGRLGLLLTGHAHRHRAMVVATMGTWEECGESKDGTDNVYFGHVFLINAFQLRFYLTHVGLEVLGVDTTNFVWKSMLLAPFLYLPVWWATRKQLRGKRSRILPDLRRRIQSEILSGALLFGHKLIMIARKPGC